MSPKSLTWGIIGAGEVVAKKWAPSLMAAPSNRVAAVLDPHRERAQPIATALNTRAARSLDELLDDDSIEIIYLATPHHLHAELGLAVLAAGKHLLCEKPMGRNIAEARRLAQSAAAAGRRLFVNYYRRFHPIVQAAREAITQADFGEVTFVEFRGTYPMNWEAPWGAAWMWDRELAGGGTILNIGVHRIDIMDYLAGGIVEVAAQCEHLGSERVERWISATFRLAGGGCGILVQHGDAHPPEDVLAIHGRKGTVRFAPFDRRLEILRGDQPVVKDYAPPYPPHLGLLEHIAAVLEGRTENTIVGGEQGLKTMELVSAMYTSALTGRMISLGPNSASHYETALSSSSGSAGADA